MRSLLILVALAFVVGWFRSVDRTDARPARRNRYRGYLHE